ncbi:MAG: extracellular solute-binding protein [Clostridiales bacterium]|nr:extracellular solute-binding protein [Candidatus Blautia equi]
MKNTVRNLIVLSALLMGISAGTLQSAASEQEGQVLNIYSWNTEFKTRLEEVYPGYEIVDPVTGKIGDVIVKWNITPSEGDAYQNNLDESIIRQAEVPDDEKIDIFLVEADNALKYVYAEPAIAVNISDLGISDSALSGQYAYTRDVTTDNNGNLKAVSWQACPGLLIYRRDIAQEVLGTDDPNEVQEYVKDWDTYMDTAAKMAEAGYFMNSAAVDSFRVFSNNVTSSWVNGNKINIDDNIMRWVDMPKEMVDAGQTNAYIMWSDDWSRGFYEEGKVFCYFGPGWFYDFCMAVDAEGSVGSQGGWAATKGPQSFFWGGTWIMAAEGTDNPSLVKEIMLNLTCNDEIMKKIAVKYGDFVNSKAVMEELAVDENFGNPALGGQNPIPTFLDGISDIDPTHLSPYDQGCVEEFQTALKNYFEGNASKEDAIELFYKSVEEKYPMLTH